MVKIVYRYCHEFFLYENILQEVKMEVEGPSGEGSVVLCTLSYTSQGVLTLRPDCTWGGRPYR